MGTEWRRSNGPTPMRDRIESRCNRVCVEVTVAEGVQPKKGARAVSASGVDFRFRPGKTCLFITIIRTTSYIYLNESFEMGPW